MNPRIRTIFQVSYHVALFEILSKTYLFWTVPIDIFGTNLPVSTNLPMMSTQTYYFLTLLQSYFLR